MSDLAVIIPHYQDQSRLERCLSALAPQLGPGVEAVVVDNASPDPVDDIVAACPGMRLVVESEKGAAPARNRGVAETTAPIIAFLDCDCVPAPNWVEAIRSVVQRADVVGGVVEIFDETPGPRSGAEAFEAVFAFDNRSYVEKRGFSVSANLITRRDVFEIVGRFRTGLSEDLDWCHRATAAGFSLTYADDVQVQHPTRSDWTALRRKWLRLTYEGWGLKGRSLGARAAWAVRALAMIPSILIHTPKVLRHPKLDTHDKVLALATLARLRLLRANWMLRQAVGLEIR